MLTPGFIKFLLKVGYVVEETLKGNVVKVMKESKVIEDGVKRKTGIATIYAKVAPS